MQQNYESFEPSTTSSAADASNNTRSEKQEINHHDKHGEDKSYIKLKSFVVCCFPKHWHYPLLKLLFSASYVIGCLDIAFMYMLFYFLLNIAKLTPITVGIMMFFGEICQMIFAPFIAALVVNFESKYFGKHRTLIVMAVLPLAFISTFLWFPVPFSYEGKVAYYLTMIVFYNLFLALLLIAYESMIPLLSSDEVDLVQINSLRLMFGSATNIGTIIVALLIFNVVVQSNLLYNFLSIISSSFLLYVFSVLVLITEEYEVPKDPSVVAERAKLKSITQLLRECEFAAVCSRMRSGFAYQFSIFNDRKFIALFLNTALFWCQLEISAAVLPIFIKDYLQINIKSVFPAMETSFVIGMLVLQFFQAIAQILIAIFADYVAINKLYIVSLAVVVVEKVFMSFVFAAGVPGWMVYPMLAVEGIAVGAAYSALETMISELVIYDQKKTGEMRGVLVYGWVDSFREISLAFGILLDSFGVEQFKIIKTSTTAAALFLFFSCLVPALLCILMVIVAYWQPLDAEALRTDGDAALRKKTDGDENEDSTQDTLVDQNGKQYNALSQTGDEQELPLIKRPPDSGADSGITQTENHV